MQLKIGVKCKHLGKEVEITKGPSGMGGVKFVQPNEPVAADNSIMYWEVRYQDGGTEMVSDLTLRSENPN